jgi:hypothetical protein
MDLVGEGRTARGALRRREGRCEGGGGQARRLPADLAAYGVRCRPDGVIESQHQVRLADGPLIRDARYTWGDRQTTERWSDPQWIERLPLSTYIDDLKTRTHKLEQRAMNEKARSMRAAEKARLQLASYAAGDEMTCQLCGRLICSKLRTIAHHGYTRPGDGWQTVSCDGARHVPLEVSNTLLVAAIADYEGIVVRLKEQMDDVQEGRAPISIQVSPHWSEKRSAPYYYSSPAAKAVWPRICLSPTARSGGCAR